MTQRNDAVLLRHLAAAIDGLADTVQLFAEINTADPIDPNVQSGLSHVHCLVSVARSHIESARSPAQEAPQPDPRDELLRELRSAAATVLDGLNERIQEAPDHAVPVFDGITELTEALVKIQEAMGDD